MNINKGKISAKCNSGRKDKGNERDRRELNVLAASTMKLLVPKVISKLDLYLQDPIFTIGLTWSFGHFVMVIWSMCLEMFILSFKVC